MYINMFLFFILGIICSYFFNNIAFRLPIKEPLFGKSKCDTCNHELTFKEKIPLISFIIQKGKCNYCNQKISPIYFIFELITGLLFSATYATFMDFPSAAIQILYGLVFISTLLIIMVSDFKYMIIPNEILIVSGLVLVGLKLYLQFQNEEISTLLDAGYEVIFMIIEAVVMFFIMFVIKKIGDVIFKKESLGGGDVKMMSLVAIVLGYKMSIIVIFIASFIALPISIYNAYKKNEAMLPFGPYLAIAAILIFLCNINLDMVLEFISK